jgi:hypothetical protein
LRGFGRFRKSLYDDDVDEIFDDDDEKDHFGWTGDASWFLSHIYSFLQHFLGVQ